MAEGFAAVPTWMIRDTAVSAYALTVYLSLASRNGLRGIFPNQGTIATEARCSERKVRDALNELEQLGVVERVRRKDRFGRSTNAYVLLSAPRPGVAAGGADTDEVAAGGAGGSGTSEQAIPLIEAEIEEADNPQTPKGAEERSRSELALVWSEELIAGAFQSFYSVYPRKVGKEAARKAFVKAAKQLGGFQVIIDGARRFALDPNLPEKQFIPHPTTWLNGGRWEDEPLPPRVGACGQTAAEQMAAEFFPQGGGDRRELSA